MRQSSGLPVNWKELGSFEVGTGDHFRYADISVLIGSSMSDLAICRQLSRTSSGYRRVKNHKLLTVVGTNSH